MSLTRNQLPKNGPLSASFTYVVFSTVNSKYVNYKSFCRWLDSNRRPLPSEVTYLSANWATTTAQQAYNNFIYSIKLAFFWSFELFARFQTHPSMGQQFKSLVNAFHFIEPTYFLNLSKTNFGIPLVIVPPTTDENCNKLIKQIMPAD